MEDYKIVVYDEMPEDDVLDNLEPGTLVLIANELAEGVFPAQAMVVQPNTDQQ